MLIFDNLAVDTGYCRTFIAGGQWSWYL